MYIYDYRIYDKYKQHPVSCAILTDSSRTWRPNHYEHERAGCEIFFKFNMIKLIDLECKREWLEKSDNPFVFIILIQLDALKLKKNTNKQRYQLKLSYTRRLYQKGFNREQIKKIYYFLDRLVKLPENVEIVYRNDLVKLEEEYKMPYVSTIERMALKEGMEKGRAEGERMALQRRTLEIALSLLSKNQSIDFVSEVTGLSKQDVLDLQNKQVNLLSVASE